MNGPCGYLRVGAFIKWLDNATADELLFGQMIFPCDDCAMYHIVPEVPWADVEAVIRRVEFALQAGDESCPDL